MKVLTAFAFTVGTKGVARVGTHAITSASAATQINNFVLLVVVIVSSSTSEESHSMSSYLFYNDDLSGWIAQTAFDNKCHDIGALLLGGYRIKINRVLITGVELRKFNSICSG